MTDEKREEVVERLSFYYRKENECRGRGWTVAADSWAAGALGFTQGIAQGIAFVEGMSEPAITAIVAQIEQEARERADAL